MKLKEFFSYKINFFVSTLIIILLASLLLYGLFSLEGEIRDTSVYASTMRLMTDLKHAQIISIVKGDSLIFATYEEGKRFKITYENSKIIFIDEEPLFGGITILLKGKGSKTLSSLKIVSGGGFEPEGKIVLKKGRFAYSLNCLSDGKILLREE